MRVRSLFVLCAVLAQFAVVLPAVAGLPGGAVAGTTTAAGALRAARASGQRTEVVAQRGEDREVYAEPDGTLTAQFHAQPVRVRRAGGWVPVDTTLRAVPGGAVAPVATALDLAFSGGGSMPLAQVGEGSRSLTMGWPAPLPAPVLSGDTATYPEVLPGVDLVVRAEVAGFAEGLVVRTRAAAANPALATVRFTLATRRLSVHADAAGNLSAVDEAGTPFVQAATPVMWDTPATGQAPAGTDPAPPVQRPMRVAISPGGLALTPDQAMLTDPATRYPVTLDPRWISYRRATYQEIDSFHPDSTSFHSDPPGNLAFGYQRFQPPTLARSFVRFNLSSVLWGGTVLSATLRTWMWQSATHDPSCRTATRAQVWVTGGFDTTTSWNHQPTWGSFQSDSTLAYGNDANPSCPDNAVEFPVTGGVTSAVARHNGITFGLKASDETDELGWRKISGAPDSLLLSVNYNHPPVVGARSTSPATSPACFFDSQHPGGGVATPSVNPASGGLALMAALSDAEGDRLTATFQVWHFGGSAPDWSQTVTAAPGRFTSDRVPMFSVTTNSGLLRDGHVYNWRVSVSDPTAGSGWSGWCQFAVDLSHPNAPGVTSAVYPPDTWSGGVGVPGSFTLDANGSTDAVRFYYSLDSPAVPPLDAAHQLNVGAGGTAPVSWTPAAQGVHHLYARSMNANGVVSADVTDHRFFVDPAAGPVGRWALDDPVGATVAADTGSGQHPGTLHGSAVFGRGRVDGGVELGGGGDYVATGAGVPTTAAFSVAAWASLSQTTDDFTVVSQEGPARSDFALRLCGGAWAFTVGGAGCGDATARVLAPAPAAAQTWYHLVGGYDPGAGQLRLYVNGVASGTTAAPPPAAATGTVQLGCAACPDAVADALPWGVDDARVYARVLSAAEIGQLVGTAAVELGHWALDEAAGSAVAADSSGGHHDAAVSGAAFGAGRTGNALVFTGSAAAVTTTRGVLRLDHSFTVTAWVNIPAGTTGTRTVLSQDAASTGAFVLQYASDTGGPRWQFAMPTDDADPPSYQAPAVYLTAAPAGWVHLAAVHDTSTGELRLYVNGRLRVTGVQDRPVNASGALQIGRDREGAGYGDYWAGSIDDVRAYWGALGDCAIAQQAGVAC